ncbi:MAG TPA: hypothetical protein VF944_10585 [Candidatus Bathyarchaeia archaeon]
MSELPLNEWVVIFYPQTGATRLCPSLAFARNYSKSVAMTNVYKSPNDFRVRHDHSFLERCWRITYDRHADYTPKSATGSVEDYESVAPDVGTEELTKLFWQFLQDIGERLSVPQNGGMQNDSVATKENYELNLGEMQKLTEDEEAFKNMYNNQARTVFTALFNGGKKFLDEDEIKKLIYTLVANRALKTKQKPWVIFQYYRPQFIKDGFIVRGKRRPKKTRA